MTKENLSKAIVTGPLPIGEIELNCAVLDDVNNTRVLKASSVFQAFGRSRKGANKRLEINGTNMPPFLASKNLEPFINKELIEWTKPIKYQDGNKIEQGYNARILPAMCKMYLDARRGGVIISSQDKLVIQSEILLSAFAEVGIVALVDEASGFQYDRKYDALRTLLRQYIADGIQKWTKRFPDRFFKELDKLYNNPQTTSRNRPMYYGKFINKYVYEPIESGYVKKELDKLNITDKNGRKARFHQWLNEFGVNQLQLQIGRVMGVMELSPNKRKFKDHIARQNGIGFIQRDLFEDQE